MTASTCPAKSVISIAISQYRSTAPFIKLSLAEAGNESISRLFIVLFHTTHTATVQSLSANSSKEHTEDGTIQ